MLEASLLNYYEENVYGTTTRSKVFINTTTLCSFEYRVDLNDMMVP